MGKHMKGPWKAKGRDGKYDNRKNTWSVTDEEAACSECAPITAEDGTVIAFAVASSDDYFSEDRVGDVARLIAAAPELLEVARMVALGDYHEDAIFAAAVDAYAKATGESHG